MQRIGLIADTHGLLRDEALEVLRGCDQLIHAGDIGRPEILQRLREIAPLSVVRGNNDTDDWTSELPARIELTVEGVRIYLVHEHAHLPADLAQRGFSVAICGHSHKPLISQHAGLCLINPGSAGPRRFKLPISVGILTVDSGQYQAQLLTLSV